MDFLDILGDSHWGMRDKDTFEICNEFFEGPYKHVRSKVQDFGGNLISKEYKSYSTAILTYSVNMQIRSISVGFICPWTCFVFCYSF